MSDIHKPHAAQPEAVALAIADLKLEAQTLAHVYRKGHHPSKAEKCFSESLQRLESVCTALATPPTEPAPQEKP